MLRKQIESQLQSFRQEGGFTEALTAERLKQRVTEGSETNSPVCPVCGKAMIKRMAKKGVNAGKPFWSCSAYPDCIGIRPFTPTPP